MTHLTRRSLLGLAGAGTAAALTACSPGGGLTSPTPGTPPSPEETPANQDRRSAGTARSSRSRRQSPTRRGMTPPSSAMCASRMPTLARRSPAPPDVADHDTVLLGCPVWGSRAPMIISTLLEGLDLRGKRLLPFVTYAVSGMAGIDEDHRSALPGTEVAEGLAVRGEAVDEAGPAAEDWLGDNGLLG